MMDDGRYLYDVHHTFVAITIAAIGIVVPVLFYVFNHFIVKRRDAVDVQASDEIAIALREMQIRYAREMIERREGREEKF